MSAVLKERSRSERLLDYLWRHQRVPFQFGVHDCAVFVARWADEEVGAQSMPRLAALMNSASISTVLRQLKRIGGYQKVIEESTGVAAKWDEKWNPGDFCIFLGDDDRQTLGLLSSRLIHAPGPLGLNAVSANRRVCHWSPECLL